MVVSVAGSVAVVAVVVRGVGLVSWVVRGWGLVVLESPSGGSPGWDSMRCRKPRVLALAGEYPKAAVVAGREMGLGLG